MQNGVEKADKEEIKPLTVYSEEDNDYIQRTPEQAKKAIMLDKMYEVSWVVQSLILKTIVDGKHYLDLGFASRDEFFKSKNISRSKAYEYLKIAEGMSMALPSGFDVEKVQTSGLLESEGVQKVAEMGVSKFSELTKIEDADFSEVFSEEEITLKNGKVIRLDDLKDYSVREFTAEIKKLRKKSTEKISRLEEDKKKLQEEKKLNDEIVKAAEQKIKDAQILERMYGGKASKLDDKVATMNDAREALQRAHRLIMNIGVTDEDPEPVQADLMALLKSVNDLSQLAQTEYDSIIATRA